ncbi:diaminopimelate decarboxylase [Lachnospiraceae bacterium]|nr:diaminopimelate decarboxylase [Lachnospiraceae bacterium]
MIKMQPQTPYYIFRSDVFSEMVEKVHKALPGIPLVYSIKANPFILAGPLPDAITRFEVCSPGELSIVRRLHIPPEKILYSGVMKELSDIREAIRYGSEILTAESVRHVELLEAGAEKEGVSGKLNVILRFSAGSQFGMSEEDLIYVLSSAENWPHLNFMGLHYFSGTGKNKAKKIKKDLDEVREILAKLKAENGFDPEIVEYGTGFAVEYFNPPLQEKDDEILNEAAPLLIEFAKEYPLSIEMGRYFAATCGEYHTSVCDIKCTRGVNYAILDGGMHHVNYFGQMMAMKMPPIRQVNKRDGDEEIYTLCGSLCTTADVLARDISLSSLEIDDELVFERTGAYSAMEAPALFLSRRLPELWLDTGSEMKLIRDSESAAEINVPLG